MAFKVLTMLKTDDSSSQTETQAPDQPAIPELSGSGIQPDYLIDGFLLRNCILAEHMKSAYLSGDYQTAGQTAQKIIQGSEHETLQTAVAWEMLAVLSWDEGNYAPEIPFYRKIISGFWIFLRNTGRFCQRYIPSAGILRIPAFLFHGKPRNRKRNQKKPGKSGFSAWTGSACSFPEETDRK